MNFLARNLDTDLGRVIRTLRIEAGMTQTDLGRAVGVSFQQMQKYESGLNRISVNRLVRLAEALGTPASDIILRLEAETRAETRAEDVPRATGT